MDDAIPTAAPARKGNMELPVVLLVLIIRLLMMCTSWCDVVFDADAGGVDVDDVDEVDSRRSRMARMMFQKNDVCT